jgi:3-isopropylmalate/(R)-2-methylmalate dehydratase small subunit
MSTIAGKVWLFGDDVNTDVMMPGAVLYGSEEAQTRALFAGTRPGWIDEVRRGDILVAGKNFGCGSSRPAARSLVNAGIACLVAESISTLFMRNCVSYGLPAFNCPGVRAAFTEGDQAEIEIEDAVIRNLASGKRIAGEPVPPSLLAIMRGGGILAAMQANGSISAPWPADG